MTRHDRARTAWVLALALGLPGCSKRDASVPAEQGRQAAGGGSSSRSQAAPAPPATLAAEGAAPAGSGGHVAGGGAGQAGLAAMVAARKLIRTGRISLEVASFETAAQQVTELAEQHAGYIAQTQVTRGHEDKQRGTLTLRVPAGRFDATLAAMRKLGKVESENVGTEDVTKAYTDLETRLRVKRDTAERLREILKSRTGGLADVLQAERELARVTEEIEQAEGERRFYDQQVALSTITAEIHEKEALVRPGALSPILEALRESLAVGATSVAVLIYAVVAGAPWVLVIWVLWRVIRAALRRRKAGPAS
jgi:hypothetical protein